MPFVPVVVPQFATVPDLPGVPPLVRAPGASITISLTVLTGDDVSISTVSQFQPWGLFDDNLKQVIQQDSVAMVRIKKSTAIADYPIEKGAFESYNKVTIPFDAEIILTKGGTISQRNTFLNQIDAVWKSLNTYSLSMPEIVYASANVVSYDVHNRTNNQGLGLVSVSLYLQEVRIAPNSQFSNTSSSGSSTTNNGSTATAPQQPANYGTTNNGTVQASINEPENGAQKAIGVNGGIY